MFVKARLVVKLPMDRAEELIASEAGEYFDPGHGRLMKQWGALIDPNLLVVAPREGGPRFRRRERPMTRAIDAYFWPTPNVQKVTIALEEMAMPYELSRW